MHSLAKAFIYRCIPRLKPGVSNKNLPLGGEAALHPAKAALYPGIAALHPGSSGKNMAMTGMEAIGFSQKIINPWLQPEF